MYQNTYMKMKKFHIKFVFIVHVTDPSAGKWCTIMYLTKYNYLRHLMSKFYVLILESPRYSFVFSRIEWHIGHLFWNP